VKAIIYYELTSTLSADRLEFRVQRKFGWVFLRLYPIVCFALLVPCGLVAFFLEYPPDWSVDITNSAAMGLLAWPILLLIGRSNRLNVLTVEGDLLSANGRGVGKTPWGSGMARVPTTQIDWLGYVGGNQPDRSEALILFGCSMSGIYVSQGGAENTCLLPGIGRAEADSVLQTIAVRFPALAQKISGVRPESNPANAGCRERPDLSFSQRPIGASIPPITRPPGTPVKVSDSRPESGEAWGNATLSVEESAQELHFRVDRETGRIGRQIIPILPPVLLLAFGIPFYTFSAFVFPILMVAALAIYGLMRKSMKPSTCTTLSVNAQHFKATGDGVGTRWMGPGEIVVRVEQIRSFSYLRTDGYDGIWVDSGSWRSKCLLPGIDRQQGMAVVVAIVRKFPELAGKART
jgi:hypothetical protein